LFNWEEVRRKEGEVAREKKSGRREGKKRRKGKRRARKALYTS
jgi:hypothetical protein